MGMSPLCHEVLRPQFHFTARKHWLNDPNGLVWHKGSYHMFFQHHAQGMTWGPMSWGHATSRDLVHWREEPIALEPDEKLGHIWSGSAVVDWRNSSGLQSGREPPLVACYTSIDPDPGAGKPGVQCLAASNDRGRTWVKYRDNPVLGHVAAANRDPKLVWHEPTSTWIMALFLDQEEYALFSSPDLRRWSRVDTITIPGTGECPDLFELPVDGKSERKLWVFWGAAGLYLLGTFDGRHFTTQSGPLAAELGPNGYAAQTWSDIPSSDGRRIQVSWMRGGRYPYMPFNQQMSFPVELTLRTFSEGVRLCRWPAKEIELLRSSSREWEGYPLQTGKLLAPGVPSGLFDVHASVSLAGADAGFTFRCHGNALSYSAERKAFTYMGKVVPARPVDGRVELRLLVDRTSLELFAESGKVSASFCFLPEAGDAPLEITGTGAELVRLEVRELRSAWR